MFSSLSLLALGVLALLTPGFCDITLSASGIAHTYTGHGGLSAGASSRLLRDYDPQIQSDILDFLFTPQFGLSLHLIKVEIGGVRGYCTTAHFFSFFQRTIHSFITSFHPSPSFFHSPTSRMHRAQMALSLPTSTLGMTCLARVGMSWP
jgi:hypothetical protein